MVIELRKLGLKVVPQARIVVYYAGQEVGEYNADLLVEDAVIVELKATRALAPANEAQLLNYPSTSSGQASKPRSTKSACCLTLRQAQDRLWPQASDQAQSLR